MNRAARRRAERGFKMCEHGYAKTTKPITGKPYCPHGCGVPHSQRLAWALHSGKRDNTTGGAVGSVGN